MSRTKNLLFRRGRTMKMVPAIPASHVAGMVVGGAIRAAARYAARTSLRKAAVVGGGLAAAGTAATLSSLGKRKSPPNRAGGYTSRRVKKVGRYSRKSSYVAGTELSSAKYTLGRKKKMTVGALTKFAVTKNICRFQNVGTLDRGKDRGAFWLTPLTCALNTLTYTYVSAPDYFADNQSVLNASNTEGYLRCPYHMYLLNSTSLNEGNTTIGIQPFICQATGNEGAFSYARLAGMNNSGTAVQGDADSTDWITEWTNGGLKALGNQDVKNIQQNWYDIKIALRNAKAQTTKFEILIISFKDDYLDPLENPAGVNEITARRLFYQNLAAESMTHPIFNRPGLSSQMKHVNIHKRVVVVMNKQQTTEEDVSPDMKIVKIFYKDGRIYDYNYGGIPDTSADVGWDLGNQNKYVQQGNAEDEFMSCIPKPRARKWLIIRAFDPTRAASVGSDTAETSWGQLTTSNNPSYDIVIRRKESFIKKT